MELVSYLDLIQNPEPVMTLTLPRKSGRIPKGTYRFLEYYCIERGCDCRRVMLQVVNEKMKPKAFVSFGFDQHGPFAGPYLENSKRQGPYAPDLLELFVKYLNAGPQYIEILYRHYVAVREKSEVKTYAGKRFPKPGTLVYQATAPPDLAAEIEESLRTLQKGRPSPGASTGPKGRPAAASPEVRPPKPETVASFVSRYVEAGAAGHSSAIIRLQDDLRKFLLADMGAGEELASLLPALYQQSPQPDEQIQGALRLLFDTLDLLDEEVEVGNVRARRSMEIVQKALARHIYAENEDPDLCAAVTNILVQSRVDILPVLRESNPLTLASCGARTDLHDLPAEDVLTGISRSFQSIGVTSPFEGVQELLDLFTLSDTGIQTALIGEMFEAEDPLLRDAAALMLFHHDSGVRLGVSRILSTIDGRRISGETLRRLIISRNWFENEVRRDVDRGIASARKARVECAPIKRLPSTTVYASSIDPVGEQSFQVLVPDGQAFARCTIVLKQEEGVVNSFVVPLKSQYQVDDIVKLLRNDPSFLESSAEHLDLRVCNALADGARAGKVPSHWLVRIAELLGRDRWRIITLDAARELLLLQEELASHDPKLLEEREYRDSVELSCALYAESPLLNRWHEHDEAVDREVEAARGRGKAIDSAAATDRILGVLEKRRGYWLERLVVTALWLKSSSRPPVKWHRIYHLAQAVADETIPFREIPLMVSIAQATLRAYISSKGKAPGKPAEVK